jgi:hypothetical protein
MRCIMLREVNLHHDTFISNIINTKDDSPWFNVSMWDIDEVSYSKDTVRKQKKLVCPLCNENIANVEIVWEYGRNIPTSHCNCNSKINAECINCYKFNGKVYDIEPTGEGVLHIYYQWINKIALGLKLEAENYIKLNSRIKDVYIVLYSN